MRKIFTILLCLCLLLLFTSCKKEQVKTKTAPKSKVTINLAEDNSVNGYRVSTPETDDTEISGDKITVQSPNTETDSGTQAIQYCGNLNSKTFHKSTCSSVKRMHDDNKFFTSDRNLLTEQGFAPCKSCNP